MSRTVQTMRPKFNPQEFWAGPIFWPNPVERWGVKYWWALLLFPFLALIGVGYTQAYSLQMGKASASLIIVRDPYILSLFSSLLLSGFSFWLWNKIVRQTFADLLSDGIVPNTEAGRKQFANYSERLRDFAWSKWRYAVIILFVAAVALAFQFLLGGFNYPGASDFQLVLRYLMILMFLGWAYGIAAVGWCLSTFVLWVAQMPSKIEIRIQAGHPDSCGGLGSIGRCCFQAVIPLLIGMVLTMVWSYSPRLKIFKDAYGDPSTDSFFSNIVPVSLILLIILFLLAVVLVLIPMLRWHFFMRKFRVEHERDYMQQLSGALTNLKTALDSGQVVAIRGAYEKLRFVRQLSPKLLRLSDWPFDRRVLAKYSITPLVSLLASFGKELFKG
jgi:ABC-type multidrug transport system fused ATPase/permease subunit